MTSIQSTPTLSSMSCKPTGWRKQFRKPTGFLGWVVGHLLAGKNRERSRWVLSLLDIQPDSHILEIGFGPGVDIRQVSEMVPQGFVAGVDHSDTMVQQACKRNARAIQAGRVELQLGSAAKIPYPDAAFDLIFAINVAQFWEEPQAVLAELQRVLKPQGRIAIAIQPRGPAITEAVAKETGRLIVSQLESTGFQQVELHFKSLKPVSVACAVGVKAGD